MITKLEGMDSRLDKQNYKKRDDAINKCFLVAADMGYDFFAVGNGGQCFGGFIVKYKHYGPAKVCPASGKGKYGIINAYKIGEYHTSLCALINVEKYHTDIAEISIFFYMIYIEKYQYRKNTDI